MRRHRFAIRVFFRLAQTLERLGRALHWAIVGMLTREDLDSMSADAWKTFGREEYFVTSGLLSWESAVYGEFVRAADRILLIGSGSGRDLLALRQAGHDIVGVEQSPATTAQAHALLRQHGLTAPIVEARFEQAAIPGTFDAIVFSWFSYCHIVGTDYVGCVHRVAHHDDAVDLLWLWDIYLLAERLSDDERGRFVALSTRTSMTAVCIRGLDLVAAWLGPGAAGQLASALRDSGGADEPSAAFLGGLTPADMLLSDLKVLPGWRPRVAMLAEHAVPSTAYMRSRYPTWPRLLLPFAYAHRFVRGLPAWFRHR